ncbi:MAG: molybdopterin-dependent oxidoreductase [Acidobacteriaceae bacterium]
MERRDFIKISALSGALATLGGCRSAEKQLIRFVPEEELIPGIATWKPSVCTLCSGGCGLQVRVMQGEAEVVRRGQQGLIKMGLAKKLEGNPQHPVNQGKLCARGQAGLQALYHPDRITQPIKRNGARGSGEFQPVTWDDALKELTSRLTSLKASNPTNSVAFLSRPLSGQRRQLVERFLGGYGVPPAIWYEPFDEGVLRAANLESFGYFRLPTFDLARADYVISFGADFLGTWNSPVAQSIGYGEMRQGRPGRRAKFVQVESRMSPTGANADEWIACTPGTEGTLALGIAHVILSEKLAPQGANARAGALIAGWSAGLPDFAPEAVEKQTGVPAAVIKRLAHELTQSGLATAMAGGAPLAMDNGLPTALAVNALESLVDTGHAGSPIMSFTPELPLETVKKAARASLSGLNALSSPPPQLLLLYEANPVFSAPPALHIRETLAKIPYIVSFGSFIDETSAQADLILPDHAPLESWIDSVPESGSSRMVVSLAPPAVLPLHDTKSMPDVLLTVAHQLGGEMAKALPWATYDAMLRAAYVPLRTHAGSIDAKTDDDFWDAMQTQGGWWSAPGADKPEAVEKREPVSMTSPNPAETAGDFPLRFFPYVSQAFGDGSLANLPWLQELPDVLTSAMWSSWVEIHPKTAERLGIKHGDLVEIASARGSIHAGAVLSPGIAPDIVAMPVGQGHENFGRFATGRGANPFAILEEHGVTDTGHLAWAETRVKVARAGGPEEAKLVLFAGGMSGFPHEEQSR